MIADSHCSRVRRLTVPFPDSRRSGLACLVGLAILWTAAWAAPAFEIRGIIPLPAGGWTVRHASDVDGYYILYGGSSVESIVEPRALELGRAEEGDAAVTEGSAVQFFRVRRVPLSEPLDLDGDGIDDVFELRHPQALDPLDPSDAEKDYDGDGFSNRTEYQQSSDPLVPAAGWTVYVVDDPPAGSADRFRTLTEAVAALDARLPAGQSGQVRVATARVQEVEALELRGDIELLADAGYEGRVALAGPGVAPLVVRSAGALSLRGWSIANAGGVRVEAGRRLQWQGNHGPGATLVVGHAASLRTLGIGRHGGSASSLLVGDSTFSGPLRLNWFGGGGASAKLGITGNSATVIEASVQGLFGGSAEVRGNVTTDLALSFEALGAAQVSVANQANLERLLFSGTSDANPNLQFHSVIATSFNLELAGVGSFFTSLDLITAKSVTLNVGAANTDLQARDLVADDLVLNLSASGGPAPRLHHSQRNVSVRQGIRVHALEAEHGFLDLSLALVNAAELEVVSRAATTLNLAEGVSLTGQLRASVTGDVLNLNAVGAKAEGGLTVQAGGVGAGLQMFWQGGMVRGRADIESAFGVSVGVTIDGTIFDPGGALAIVRGGEGASMIPGDPPGGRRLSRAQLSKSGGGSPSILLRNLVTPPGSVLIAEMESPVTIENCQFSGSTLLPVVTMEEVQGAIQVRDCTFSGQGLAISDAGGEATVQGVQIDHAGGAMPALGISGTSAVVEDVTIGGAPLTGLALNLSGSATVQRVNLGEGGLSIGGGQVQLEDLNSEGMATITDGRVQARNSRLGSVITIAGNALLGFEDCALGGVIILDMNESGGLLTDPVTQGANPEEVISWIDFDNDQLHCADYPPPQTRPDTGECIRPGVAPPK
ncbi:MAG: hypothetical protein AB9869_08100 [Verrucomicrobiia bacterium]